MMQLKIHQFDLPLLHPFTISRESITVQSTIIVELIQDGVSGYGESTTNAYYGVTEQSLRDSLQQVRDLIEGIEMSTPGELWSVANELLDDTFALCALDLAAHDLWGKLQGAPVHQLWGLSTDANPLSNYTIGIDDIDVMVAKMAEFSDWPIYKIKLGTERDLEIITALREHTKAIFRVDANCAWDPNEAAALSGEMARQGVEFIEQPLEPEAREAQAQLFLQSALPLIADENCVGEDDVPRCVDHFHGINIKLCKCGGLTPARRMITAARDHGLKVMVGCMTESSVGISAAAQLAPLLDYADLDGAVLLAEDAADGVQLHKGQLTFLNEPGLGIQSLK